MLVVLVICSHLLVVRAVAALKWDPARRLGQWPSSFWREGGKRRRRCAGDVVGRAQQRGSAAP